jgi:hypothetical protein
VDLFDASLEVQIPLWEKTPDVGARTMLGIPVDKLIWYRFEE